MTSLMGGKQKTMRHHVMTEKQVLIALSEIAGSEWRDHVQVNYGQGGQVIDAQLQLSDKLQALELLGMHYGLFGGQVRAVPADGAQSDDEWLASDTNSDNVQ
jgi:hypothetical protein